MKKKNKKPPLVCHICGDKATHAVMMELREKQGPPLKENNVIRLACDTHAKETSFDYWVSNPALMSLINFWKREAGIILNKRYCTIKLVKLKKV